MKVKKALVEFITEDYSYKLVALLITLLIWLLVMGREHVQMEHEIYVQMQVPDNFIVESRSPESVRVKLKGPPKILKRYIQSRQDIVIRIKKPWVGSHRIKITSQDLHLPFGLRLVTVSPKYLKADLKKRKIENETEIEN